MNRNFQFFLIIFLLPTLGETIAANKFSVSIPGSPFTLGRITFIIVGIIGIVSNKIFLFSSNTSKGFFLIFFGGMVGGLFSNQVEISLSRSLGIMILFIASIGIASLWELPYLRKFLDFFFILNFSYWTFYVYDLTLSKGSTFIAYSQLFLDKEAVNHHIIGVNASVSSVYLAIRYFYINNQLKLWGYLLIFIGVITCFLCESRSNLLFTVISLSTIIYFSKVKLFKLFLITIPILVLMYAFLTSIAEKNESLFQRFDLTDEDYQERTTGMRFDFIEGFFEAFVSNPLGKGVFGAEITYGTFQSTMLHNQYLTFMLSGGLLALIGICLWIYEFMIFFLINGNKKIKINSFDYAIVFSSFTFLITLVTIEFSGLLFFLFISLLLYQAKISKLNKMLLKTI